MEQFVNNITSFPTLVYTVLLGVVMIYWLLSMVGAVDLDSIDLDLDIDADVDPSGISGLTGFMLTFGLTGVPVSVAFSLLILLSWLICFFVAQHIVVYLPGTILQVVGGVAALVASFFASLPIVAQMIKPLRGLFKTHTAVKKEELVGSICTVTTLDVTDAFGQGELADGEAGMILALRSKSPNSIKKGDRVVIIAYDEQGAVFEVIPESELLIS